MVRNRLVQVFILIISFLFIAQASASEPWRFIAVGDSRGSDNGVNTPILTEIATQIINQNAEFVVFPGDLVEGYVDQVTLQSQLMHWRDIMQPVYNAGIGVYPVRGNHDVGSPGGTTAWNNVFSGAYALPQNGPTGEKNLTYSFAHKNVFVAGLDEYVNVDKVNQTWLNGQFGANDKAHVFAFGHVPAFQANHTDCLDDYPTNRNAFWTSLKNEGGRTYFCGHDHFYDHARIDDGDGIYKTDLHQFIVGTAGAPLNSWSPPYNGSNTPYVPIQRYHATQYGYLLVEINERIATLSWWQRMSPGVYQQQGVVLTYTVVPEPSAIAILIFGFGGIFFKRRFFQS
jgi:hypothetical protein